MKQRHNLRSNTGVNRRQLLSAIAGAGAFFIPAWNETIEAADSIVCVPTTPTVTDGPYWVDEKLFRSDIRTDPSTGTARAGIPLTLKISVQNLSGGSCAPLAGAYVDVWHCDAKGIYSDEGTYNPGGGTGSVNTSGQKFLRGYQITDSDGAVTFTTIYPGWYSGRTIHIHVRIRTYSGNTVLSNFVTQVFFDDTINDTVMGQSAYSRTTARDTRNSNDMVYNVANQTRMLSTTSGNVTDGYTSSIVLGAIFTTPPAAAPSVNAGGVGSAVSAAAGTAPNSWVSVYGLNFATATRELASADLVNNTLPTSLAGVSVQINGKKAYIRYVSPIQLVVLTPADDSTGSVSVSVTNSIGASNSITTNMSAVLPGLSTYSGYVRAVRFPDGAIVNGTGSAETGYTTVAAAAPGDYLALFGTGFGPTNPSAQDGVVFSGAYPTTTAVTVTVGVAEAQVLWAGLIGPGLYQVNIQLPPNLPTGDLPVVASVSGVSSQTSGAALKVSGAATTSLLVPQSLAVSARAYWPAALRKRAGLEQLISLGGLFAPGQHPDAGISVSTDEEHGGRLVQLR